MAAVAIGSSFREVFDGCISSTNSDKSKRPYHKYCKCAFHKSSPRRSGPCADAGSNKCRVSFPLRPSNWSKRSLGVLASSLSGFTENSQEVGRKKNAELLVQSFGLAEMEA